MFCCMYVTTKPIVVFYYSSIFFLQGVALRYQPFQVITSVKVWFDILDYRIESSGCCQWSNGAPFCANPSTTLQS